MRVWLLAALVACIAVAGYVVTREEPSCSIAAWSYTFGGPTDPSAEGAATTPEEALAWYVSQDPPKINPGTGDPLSSNLQGYAREATEQVVFTGDGVRLYPSELSGGVWAIAAGETIC